jgi:hypothetical protein
LTAIDTQANVVALFFALPAAILTLSLLAPRAHAAASDIQMLPPLMFDGKTICGPTSSPDILAWDGVRPIHCIPGFTGDSTGAVSANSLQSTTFTGGTFSGTSVTASKNVTVGGAVATASTVNTANALAALASCAVGEAFTKTSATTFACVSVGGGCKAGDTLGCSVANGSGDQVCSAGAWGSCVTTSCNPGYTLSGGVCVPATSCTPGSQTASIACPAGYTGVHMQQRDFTCPGSVWGAWFDLSDTCAAPLPVATTYAPPMARNVAGNLMWIANGQGAGYCSNLGKNFVSGSETDEDLMSKSNPQYDPDASACWTLSASNTCAATSYGQCKFMPQGVCWVMASVQCR